MHHKNILRSHARAALNRVEMSRALNCSDLAFAPVDTFGVAACVACRTDLGFSIKSGHSFAVSGEDNALTFGTRPFAEHSQIRTTSLREAGVTRSAFTSRLQQRGQCRHSRSSDRDNACGSAQAGAHS